MPKLPSYEDGTPIYKTAIVMQSLMYHAKALPAQVARVAAALVKADEWSGHYPGAAVSELRDDLLPVLDRIQDHAVTLRGIVSAAEPAEQEFPHLLAEEHVPKGGSRYVWVVLAHDSPDGEPAEVTGVYATRDKAILAVPAAFGEPSEDCKTPIDVLVHYLRSADKAHTRLLFERGEAYVAVTREIVAQ